MYNKLLVKGLVFGLVILFSHAFDSHGQRPLQIDEIKVIAPYEPSISDAFKINLNPVITDTLAVEMDFDYSIRPQKIVTRYTPGTLAAATVPERTPFRRHSGLVKAGFGNYQTPYFKGFYTLSATEDFLLGVKLKHLSSGKGIEELENSIFSRNKAGIYATRQFKNTSLDVDVHYDRHTVHYYGNTETGLSHDGVRLITLPAAGRKQRYDFLSTGMQFGTHHADSSKTRYRAGFTHKFLADRFDASEHHFGLTGMLGKDISEGIPQLSNPLYVQVDMSADYFYNQRFPGDTQNTGIYSIKPAIHSQFGSIHMHLGVNLAVEDYNADYRLRAYPVSGLEVMLVPGTFNFFATLTGSVEKQSYRKLSQQNPFVQPLINLQFSNIRSAFSTGFKGSFNDRLSYRLSLNHSNIRNQAFYSLAIFRMPLFDNRFEVIYDDMKLLNFRAELVARAGDHFSLKLRGDYFEYDLRNESKPWHMPAYSLALNASYTIAGQFIVSADVYGFGDTYGRFLSPWRDIAEARLISFYTDINLGVEYRYNQNFSAFLNFSNLQNASYEVWTFYPTYKLGLLGGISYSF